VRRIAAADDCRVMVWEIKELVDTKWRRLHIWNTEKTN